jgi:5'-nucleotidase
MTSFLDTPEFQRVYCNRTLNMRSIDAIGYDMDYTLIQYRVVEWEQRAYDYAKNKLLAMGWDVADLAFDPTLIVRGLVIDVQHGNLLKVNSFGYVKHSFHGTQPIPLETQRALYSRTRVSLAERRYIFLNTLFSLSEACLYAQLVDKLDARVLPGAMGYSDLYQKTRACIDETHFEGQLKAEIMQYPERFVQLDPYTPMALLDQKRAGKKLLLITNSEWHYTSAMMSYVFDRFLPGMTWKDVFDVVIVSARKPEFFSHKSPLFEIVNEEGLLKPSLTGLYQGGVFLGGDATQVEEFLGIPGDQILYVGDHIWGDVQVSKSALRWRTALVMHELEEDLYAVKAFQETEQKLEAMMQKKSVMERSLSMIRLQLQRLEQGYGENVLPSHEELKKQFHSTRQALVKLDAEIAPWAEKSSRLNNERWGLMMRAGNDKSHLARQIERYADIYMSKVSNMMYATPFAYLRARRGLMPHDIEI